MKTGNIADEVMSQLAFKYNRLNEDNCLGIEDFNAEPEFQYIKSTNRKYTLIKNRLFYLIDSTFSLEETHQYIRWFKSWISLGIFLRLGVTEKRLITTRFHKELTDEMILARRSFWRMHDINCGRHHLFKNQKLIADKTE